MKEISQLVWLNCEYLGQGKTLLARLDPAVYDRCDPPLYASGIGSHVRHVLEHYQMFLEGLPLTHICYDARRRDLRLSSDPTFAIQQIEQIQIGLNALSLPDIPLKVALTGSHIAGEPEIVSTSTLKRELHYLQAHTVHHYALIAVILRLNQVSVDDGFGVAPSTLRFHHQNA